MPRQFEEQCDFRGHVLAYVLINAFLVVIWVGHRRVRVLLTCVPIAIWGIGVIMNAWDVYGRQDISQDDIKREMHPLTK